MQTNLGFMPPVMADGPEECLLDQSFRTLRPIALVFHVLPHRGPTLALDPSVVTGVRRDREDIAHVDEAYRPA